MQVVRPKGEVGSYGRLRLDVPVELCPERAKHPSPSHPVPLFPLPWGEERGGGGWGIGARISGAHMAPKGPPASSRRF